MSEEIETPERSEAPNRPPMLIRGTVAQDVEVKTTANNRQVANVLIAAHHVERHGIKLDAAENKWHTVTFWGEAAEQAATDLKKGTKVAIAGEQHLREYEKDGATRTASEIRNASYEVRSIEIKGMVAHDPELAYSGSGTAYTRVLVAADELAKAGQKVDPAENKWHQAVFFGERAEQVASELKKGMVVHLSGEHQVQSYRDKQGADRTLSEVLSPKIDIRTIELKGTIAKDPELKHTGAGKPYAHIVVAADEISRGNQKLDPAENKWHQAVFWGEKAEQAVASLKKGMSVEVVGEQRLASFEGRDGQVRTTSEIHMPKLNPLERQRAQGLAR